MKKFKTWWANVNEPNLMKQHQLILNMLLEIDCNKITLEESLVLFNMVKLSFDNIVSKKKEQALKDFNLCEIYEGKDLTKNASKIKVLIQDENFDKPIEKLTKNY